MNTTITQHLIKARHTPKQSAAIENSAMLGGGCPGIKVQDVTGEKVWGGKRRWACIHMVSRGQNGGDQEKKIMGAWS